MRFILALCFAVAGGNIAPGCTDVVTATLAGIDAVLPGTLPRVALFYVYALAAVNNNAEVQKLVGSLVAWEKGQAPERGWGSPEESDMG